MKRYIVPLLLGGFCLFFSCSRGDADAGLRTITAEASFSGSGTRADMEMSSESLDLITRWKEDDVIRLYFVQEGTGYTLAPVTVHDISEDGKRCSFEFQLPPGVSWDQPYEIYGLSDAGGFAQEGESTVVAKSRLRRMPWDKRIVPMWFHAAGSSDRIQAEFRHLGTYEILHLENASSKVISFRHEGFDVEEPWYKSSENTPLREEYDPTQYVSEPGDDAQSESVSIAAGETGIFLSWYIPSGALITGARLVATIDGKRVLSNDAKSSDVRIQRGHAYHMYAIWDGATLSFTSGGGSEVDAGGSGYGTDGNGDVRGSGLGYGTDSEGNIIGGGSGYGSDSSGNISSGGSGYSNAN